jgi:hypothetical protein
MKKFLLTGAFLCLSCVFATEDQKISPSFRKPTEYEKMNPKHFMINFIENAKKEKLSGKDIVLAFENLNIKDENFLKNLVSQSPFLQSKPLTCSKNEEDFWDAYAELIDPIICGIKNQKILEQLLLDLTLKTEICGTLHDMILETLIQKIDSQNFLIKVVNEIFTYGNFFCDYFLIAKEIKDQSFLKEIVTKAFKSKKYLSRSFYAVAEKIKDEVFWEKILFQNSEKNFSDPFKNGVSTIIKGITNDQIIEKHLKSVKDDDYIFKQDEAIIYALKRNKNQKLNKEMFYRALEVDELPYLERENRENYAMKVCKPIKSIRIAQAICNMRDGDGFLVKDFEIGELLAPDRPIEHQAFAKLEILENRPYLKDTHSIDFTLKLFQEIIDLEVLKCTKDRSMNSSLLYEKTIQKMFEILCSESGFCDQEKTSDLGVDLGKKHATLSYEGEGLFLKTLRSLGQKTIKNTLLKCMTSNLGYLTRDIAELLENKNDWEEVFFHVFFPIKFDDNQKIIQLHVAEFFLEKIDSFCDEEKLVKVLFVSMSSKQAQKDFSNTGCTQDQWCFDFFCKIAQKLTAQDALEKVLFKALEVNKKGKIVNFELAKFCTERILKEFQDETIFQKFFHDYRDPVCITKQGLLKEEDMRRIFKPEIFEHFLKNSKEEKEAKDSGLSLEAFIDLQIHENFERCKKWYHRELFEYGIEKRSGTDQHIISDAELVYLHQTTAERELRNAIEHEITAHREHLVERVGIADRAFEAQEALFFQEKINLYANF